MLAHKVGPLLPKLRGQFAEFLQHTSLKRLGILYQSTCVGLGYGLREGSFLERLTLPVQSNKHEQNLASVTLSLAHECLRGSHRLRGVRLTLGAG